MRQFRKLIAVSALAIFLGRYSVEFNVYGSAPSAAILVARRPARPAHAEPAAGTRPDSVRIDVRRDAGFVRRTRHETVAVGTAQSVGLAATTVDDSQLAAVPLLMIDRGQSALR